MEPIERNGVSDPSLVLPAVVDTGRGDVVGAGETGRLVGEAVREQEAPGGAIVPGHLQADWVGGRGLVGAAHVDLE